MNSRHIYKLTLGLAAICLSGCSTVKLPDLDVLKMSGFFDEIRNVEGYPKVSDTPAVPTDIRSDTAWDAEAKKLISLREEFDIDGLNEPRKTEEEIARDVEALKARVRAYKLDDPQ